MAKFKWIGLAILSVALVGCQKDVVEETTQEVVSQQVTTRTVEVYGEVQGNNEKEIVLGFPATIKEVHVKPGDKKQAGDTLFTIDYEDYLLQIAMVKAEIDSLSVGSLDPAIRGVAIEIEQLNRDLATKQNELEERTNAQYQSLQNSLEPLVNELELAKDIYEVKVELYEVGAVSEKELEQYALELQVKESAIEEIEITMDMIVKTQEQEIQSIKTQIGVRNEQIAGYKAQASQQQQQYIHQVESMKLGAEQMERQLEVSYLQGDKIIVENDNAVIKDIYVVEGSKVSEVTGPIIRMIQVDPLEIKIEIPEDEVGFVQVGDMATVMQYTQTGEQSYLGEVTWIGESAKEVAGDTIVEGIVTLKEETPLKVGMSVEVIIERD